MPAATPFRSDVDIDALRPRRRPYKLFDGGGMYIHVLPRGGKYWRLKYYFAGKEKLLSLGTFPGVTLTEARKRADIAKRVLAMDRDPSSEKRGRVSGLAAVKLLFLRWWLGEISDSEYFNEMCALVNVTSGELIEMSKKSPPKRALKREG